MTRKITITRAGGRRRVARTRTASPKHPSRVRPGRGWFSWLWGNNTNRYRINLPAFFAWEKKLARRKGHH